MTPTTRPPRIMETMIDDRSGFRKTFLASEEQTVDSDVFFSGRDPSKPSRADEGA
jgi:hypothetical protein